MNFLRVIALSSWAGLGLLVAGCSLRQPAPVKQTFLTEATRTQASRTPRGQTLLAVHSVRVAAPFDARSFVYRRTDLNYQLDFYHEFLVPPRLFLTEQIVQWLDGSGLFAFVDATGKMRAPHALAGTVSAFYGDYRQTESPKAVLAIQFVLTDEQSRPGTPIWRQTYQEQVTLTQTTPESLAAGWSSALTKILAALENDLSATLSKP